MAFTIRTIEDMERLYYGSGAKFITKSDDPILSATTGVYNAIYGAQVWAILNQEANVFGVLPKYPWDRSGWRLQESRAGVTADGGVAEAGLLPETLKPDWREVTTKPKTVAHTFEVSEIQQFLTEADDAIGDLEMMRGVMGVKHKEAVNQQLAVFESGTVEIRDQVISDMDLGDDADLTKVTAKLYTYIKLNPDNIEEYHVAQAIEGIAVPESNATYPTHLLPWLPLVWNRTRREMYGRGLVEDHYGAFYALSVLTEALVTGGAIMTDFKFLVQPGSLVDVAEMNAAASGSYHYGEN